MTGQDRVSFCRKKTEGGVDMQKNPAYWNVERRYMEYGSSKYMVDIIHKNGYRIMIEDMNTRRRNEGFHKISENEALMDALRKF
jgi:hypothetical protein